MNYLMEFDEITVDLPAVTAWWDEAIEIGNRRALASGLRQRIFRAAWVSPDERAMWIVDEVHSA